eukprot:TRINITY_DN27994_c0_g1_i1.p1 TRINITY_DN27994_c0_g1~~TRINITY_DN27994_c0_g1_i1.p1  ORF type:complete len:396 (-),score=61.67 TRINITY_DN27994_c0_g1_i1:10-1122(-)
MAPTAGDDVGGAGPEADYGLATAPTCAISSFDALDASSQALAETLRKDGVVCVRKVFTQEQVAELRAAYDECWAMARASMVDPECSGPWVRRVFNHFSGSKTAPLDKGLYNRVPIKQLSSKASDVKGQYGNQSVIVRMGKGRYDFTHNMENTVLSKDEATRPEPIRSLLGSFLGPESEWHSYPGGLPAEGTCGPGRWHRDTYSLWDDEEMDAAILPFYFTMIAPLTRVREEDGPTQFRLGSHLLPTGKVGAAPLASVELEAGDAILFDGRIVHRGGPRSKAAGARHALYTVHHKWWYTDDDMSPPITRIEPLKPHEIARIEEEEPWTKVQRGSVFSALKQFLLDDRLTLALSLATAAVFGYTAAIKQASR